MRPRMLFWLGGVIIIGLIVATLSAYAFKWWTALYSAIPFLAGSIGLFSIVFILIRILLAKVRNKPGLMTFHRSFLLATLFLLSQFAYFPLSKLIFNWEIERAQAFAESLIPTIEAYKSQHGAYPNDLSLILPPDASPPSLLRLSATQPFEFDNRAFYRQRGTTYGFQFYVPDGFMGYSYEYCCGAHGQWTVTD